MDNSHPNDPRQPHEPPHQDENVHEGATEEQVGDRGGPGAGYDQEPEEVPGKGGVVS
jgi:hypothetical protein